MDDPYTAADAAARGEIDAVGLTRPLLADPDWPAKVEKGDIENIRRVLPAITAAWHVFLRAKICAVQ
ncbi:hypothetical protein [Biomaibacter acetigenes]|uniref:hypothetical protein n=1 Tax=Biomaibacter acetigenes TaxID=2316383 RepID=UPI001FE2F3AA